jgi:hypothetical protein
MFTMLFPPDERNWACENSSTWRFGKALSSFRTAAVADDKGPPPIILALGAADQPFQKETVRPI